MASPDDAADRLESHFDPAALTALRQWAEGKGGSARLPAQLWRAGGLSGSMLVAIVLDQPGPRGAPVGRKMIVKVLPAGPYARETGLHEHAWIFDRRFAEKHLVRQLDARYPVGDGRFLMFQELAGPLGDLHTLRSLPPEVQAGACGAVAHLILHHWNALPDQHPAGLVGADEYLRTELRDALGTGRSARRWSEQAGLLRVGCDWVTTDEDGAGRPMPNPVALAGHGSIVRDVRIEQFTGLSHGDLHLDNVLVSHRPPGPPALSEARLVDLSAFQPDGPLTRDFVTLALSVAAHELRGGVSASEAEEMLALLVEPRTDARGSGAGRAIGAMQGALDGLPAGWRDDWRAQYQLSVVAQALVHVSYDDLGDDGRWWFFRLAARAGAAFVVDLRDPPDPAGVQEVTKPVGPAPGGSAAPQGEAGPAVSGLEGLWAWLAHNTGSALPRSPSAEGAAAVARALEERTGIRASASLVDATVRSPAFWADVSDLLDPALPSAVRDGVRKRWRDLVAGIGGVGTDEADRGLLVIVAVALDDPALDARVGGLVAEGDDRSAVALLRDVVTERAAGRVVPPSGASPAAAAETGSYLDDVAALTRQVPRWQPAHTDTDAAGERRVNMVAADGRVGRSRYGTVSWRTALDGVRCAAVIAPAGYGKSWALRRHVVDALTAMGRNGPDAPMPVWTHAGSLAEAWRERPSTHELWQRLAARSGAH